MTTTTNAGDGKDDKSARHWAKTAHFLGLSAWERVSYVSRIYRNAMPVLFGLLLLAFGLGVWLNRLGLKEWNVILMFLTMMAWVFLTFHPKALVHVLTFGALKGLPNTEIEKIFKNFDLPDFELNKVLGSAGKELKGYMRITAHIALFWTAAFGVLALFQLEHGWAAYAVLAFLAGIGLWSIVYKAPTKVYRFTTGVIMTFGLVTTVIAGYRIMHPQDETVARIERALMVRDDAKKEARAQALLARIDKGGSLNDAEWEELNNRQAEKAEHGLIASGYESARQAIGNPIAYEETFQVAITSTSRSHQVCGIKPGNRTFTVPKIYFDIYEFTGAVRVNGQPGHRSSDGESFSGSTRVRGDGCVNVTFAGGEKTFEKQILFLTFR